MEPLAARTPAFGRAFRGYRREEVDQHLVSLNLETEKQARDVERLRAEVAHQRIQLDSLLEENTRFLAALEAAQSGYKQMETDLASARTDVALKNEELASVRVQLSRAQEDEGRVAEILRAAQAAAEQLRGAARAEAESVLQEAERRAERLDEQTRNRAAELSEQFERMKGEYAEFLANARRLAQGFVHTVDAARE